MAAVQPVLQFDVEYPEHLSRWKIFFKWLLALPHLIILSVFQYLIEITTFLSWFAILFTGRYPRGLWDLSVTYMRWQARVYAYAGLLRDEYPPFGTGDYPVQFQLDYPASLSRWKIFLKWLMAIPSMVVLMLLSIGMIVVSLIAFFAILFTGRYPRGMFTFVVGVQRWGYRLSAYLFLLTDAYPPFTLAPIPSPTAGLATGAA
jgi:Domain of unknown function (DUF4389)